MTAKTDWREIRSDVDGRLADSVELLRVITQIESHASQRAGIEQVAAVLGERLAAVGFEIETVPQPGVPADLAWYADVMSPGVPYDQLGDAYVARRDGSGDRRLLLLGDLDTAFLPGSSERFPFRVDGDLVRGPGVADMKGGLVVMMAAIEALARFDLPTPPMTVVLSGDEQAGSLGSRATVEREAAESRWCLCLECARGGGRLMGARGQVGVGRLEVVGRETYSGDPDDAGINAIEAISYLVPAIQRVAEREVGTIVSVNIINGGRRRSIVPARASAIVDVRTRTQADWNRTATRLYECIAEATQLGEASLLLYSHRPAVEWTSETDRMLRFLQSAGKDIGLTVEALASPAAGSSAFAASAGATTFDGLGPVGGGIMTEDEHVVATSLSERATLLARTISGLIDLE